MHIEDRVAWLNWQPKMPRVESPSWTRIQQLSALKHLDADKKLFKYAGDLALVIQVENGSKAFICLVPRLPVTVEEDGKKRQKRRLPRLLHPKAIGEPEGAVDIGHPMDPNMWWRPNRPHELESLEPGIYRLLNVRNPDDLSPPFAIFSVPLGALNTAVVVPRLSELSLFTQGMLVGAAELDFISPSREFIRWTYERHVAAPVEIGHKVEADLKPGMVRGVVEDIQIEEIVVHINNTEDVISVDSQGVRRFYEAGDAVKVINSSHINREGWVLDMKEDIVDVFDRLAKEEV